MSQSANPTPSFNTTDFRTVTFESVPEPGAYICNWSGHLLQIPPAAFEAGSLSCNIIGNDSLYVTSISDDPSIPIDAAREVASKLEVDVNF